MRSLPYAHLSPEFKREAVDRMDNLWEASRELSDSSELLGFRPFGYNAVTSYGYHFCSRLEPRHGRGPQSGALPTTGGLYRHWVHNELITASALSVRCWLNTPMLKTSPRELRGLSSEGANISSL